MRRFSKKRARLNRDTKADRDAYRKEFPWCQRPGCQRRARELHEISRGRGIRSQSLTQRAAWLHLCEQDHRDCGDYSKVPIVTQMAWKKWSDPLGYDRRAVNLLRGRAPDAITEQEVDAELSQITAPGFSKIYCKITKT